jgi:hypothetical protein
MEPLKIIIDNWPSTSWMTTYSPILIAGVALLVSLYSAHLSRKSYRLSSRPYVWASSYGVIDQAKNTIIPVAQRLGYCVTNAPTKIIQNTVKVLLGDREVFSHSDNDFVRFPDGSSEWSFSIGESEFTKILSEYKSSGESLSRKVNVSYSSLDGGKEYSYTLIQEYIETDSQWKDISSQAT